ncbi:MAG: arylamine N-acetyltransferase [Oscillospiraceae bacterium]|nr:arylamine N-acetyltransferase [Oscillospiraceae bacterium]
MFDLSMYTPEMIADYFDRIGYKGDGRPTLENLREILFCHLSHVPFENLDILAGIPLSVDPQYLFQKIVKDRKGGFCFEMNGAFSHLLRSLGYECRDHLCRMTTKPGLVRPRLHRVTTVKADGARWMVDVGLMGDMPRNPLLLEANTVQYDGVNSYKLLYHEGEGWRYLQRPGSGEGEFTSKYHFMDIPQMPQDFITPCYYCEAHPTSNFRAGVRVSLLGRDSCTLLSDGRLRTFRGDKVEEIPCETREEQSKILREYFDTDFRD